MTVEADLEARLAKLADIFGTTVVLGEPQELKDEDPEVMPISSPQNWATNTSAENEGAQDKAASEADNAPVKFQLHDVGPRPCTDGAFDSSKFMIGEPTDDDMEFCPWKVITEYPEHFIGKTNRPHV